MALLDSDSLLRPVTEADPAGPNLEYDAAFAELERAMAGKPEQQIGNVLIPAEEPSWNEVRRLAVELLVRTKDLRIACPLVRALAAKHGLAGLSEGLSLVRGLLERYWEGIHPRLDPDDDNDPTIRVNSLTALCDPESIQALRAAPLFVSRTFGPVSARDCLAIGQTNGETPRLDSASIDGAFVEIAVESLGELVGSAEGVLAHLQGIEQTFERHVGSRGPDMSRLQQFIQQILKFLRPRYDARRAESGAVPAGADGAPSANGAPLSVAATGAALSGDVRSRDEVVRALDKICEYYRRYEPSSPVPLLIERCKRLVSMDFLDILRDLAPDGLSQAEAVTGAKRES